MTLAIFNRRFTFDRRPKMAIAYQIEPSPEPQDFPGDVVKAAVEAGAAERVPKPERERREAAQTEEIDE